MLLRRNAPLVLFLAEKCFSCFTFIYLKLIKENIICAHLGLSKNYTCKTAVLQNELIGGLLFKTCTLLNP